MSTITRAFGIAGAALLAASIVLLTAARHADSDSPRLAPIVTHDNRVPAGVLRDGVLTIDLVAGRGSWFPERDAGPGHDVYAFGESGQSLSNPGPLIRVPAGTEIRARIRNTLDRPLIVRGLHDRPGAPSAITVPAGGTSDVRFRVHAPGTYHYWGSTRATPTLRDRFGMDGQLSGALIVDAPGAAADDHVFLLGVEDDSAAVPRDRKLTAAAINGRAWPHSQISSVMLGDTIRTRWINTTDRSHPIHLHGFYFRVDARGDIALDTIYDAERQRVAVTELLLPGQTMTATWVPDRAGNWLMHCHMAVHMGPELRQGKRLSGHDTHAGNHTLDVMSGLVVGWRVQPKRSVNSAAERTTVYRPVRMLAQSAPRRYGDHPALGFVIQTNDVAPRADSVVVPGPPLVLTRGEPVQITVVNRLAEPTSIHWHGIELDSYYDGVSGWSGDGARLAPHIMPGDSFIVRFTPPRAGTFIYHSHFNEEHQLSSGMYGPIIVVEPGTAYDPRTDLVWLFSQNGPSDDIRVVLNGSAAPSLELDAGRRYRIRLININPNVPLLLSLVQDSTPVQWRAIAKDGATLPPSHALLRRAVQLIGVGEAYDFEFESGTARELVIRSVDAVGGVVLAGRVRVR